MEEQSQQDYLKAAKAALGVEWDALAELAGIKPRALKTYRMPDSSKDHRGLPDLARRAIDRLISDHHKTRKASKRQP
jgi:predicted metallo-beta-lactamase superfamily hydrolase